MHQHDDHPHGEGLPRNMAALYEELVHHLPFSVSSVAVGLVVAGIICFVTPTGQMVNEPDDAGPICATAAARPPHEAAATPGGVGDDAHQHDHGHDHADNPFRPLFHLFHPVHMLFSATATTAMFWRYDRRLVKAIIVGVIGSVGICGISDIVIPQVSLMILGRATPWHICLIEHPQMVLSFAAVGVLVGLTASRTVRRSTLFSHSLHVFVSTMASIFYLIGPLGRLGWIDSIGTVLFFIILAVMVPCCISDIVFPLLLIGRGRDVYRDEHVPCEG